MSCVSSLYAPTIGRQPRLDQLLPGGPFLDGKVDMLRRRRMQLVPPEHGAIAVAGDDGLLCFLEDFRHEVEVGHHTEGPTGGHVKAEVRRQIFTLADVTTCLPLLQRVSPEVLEQTDAVHGLPLQDVADPFDSGHCHVCAPAPPVSSWGHSQV